jgi:hypothetical protein
MSDINDITNWSAGLERLVDYFVKGKDDERPRPVSVSPIPIDAKRVYGLLASKINADPNGFYTVRTHDGGKPMDQMIWWDFALQFDDVVVHLWQTPLLLEAHVFCAPEGFDLVAFLGQNIGRYAAEIDERIKSYERHTLFINHYKGYQKSIRYLWDEIQSLNLAEPFEPRSHVVSQQEIDRHNEEMSRFLTESLKLHALGKSLILSCAFGCDAFLNTLIRIGLRPPFKTHPETVKRYLGASFGSRLVDIELFTLIFGQAPDLKKQVVKDACELMTMRNKYVHSDETSHLNRIGSVLFDRDFPVFGIRDVAFGVEGIKRDLHNPPFDRIEWAYGTFTSFIEYLTACIDERWRDEIVSLADQNHIGYNESKKVYSVIYGKTAASFYLVAEPRTQAETGSQQSPPTYPGGRADAPSGSVEA